MPIKAGYNQARENRKNILLATFLIACTLSIGNEIIRALVKKPNSEKEVTNFFQQLKNRDAALKSKNEEIKDLPETIIKCLYAIAVLSFVITHNRAKYLKKLIDVKKHRYIEVESITKSKTFGNKDIALLIIFGLLSLGLAQTLIRIVSLFFKKEKVSERKPLEPQTRLKRLLDKIKQIKIKDEEEKKINTESLPK